MRDASVTTVKGQTQRSNNFSSACGCSAYVLFSHRLKRRKFNEKCEWKRDKSEISHSVSASVKLMLMSTRFHGDKSDGRNGDGRKKKISVPSVSASVELTLVSTRFHGDMRALLFGLRFCSLHRS